MSDVKYSGNLHTLNTVTRYQLSAILYLYKYIYNNEINNHSRERIEASNCRLNWRNKLVPFFISKMTSDFVIIYTFNTYIY